MLRHFRSRFWIGDKVYLAVDQYSPQAGLITAITITPAGITYSVQWVHSNSYHYEFELSSEPIRDLESFNELENDHGR